MLEPPDTFHFSAAIGWLELGNPIEANEELEKISPEYRALPEVLSIRLDIYCMSKKWLETDTIARALIQLQPQVPSHWTTLAYATRRKSGGSIPEAKEILLKAARLFPDQPMIYFNLSCYEAQLGNLAQAKDWLDKAYEVGNRRHIQEMVLSDPDLEPLRKEYRLES